VGAAARAPNVARTRLVVRIGATLADVIVRSIVVGHKLLPSWTLTLVGGDVLDERGPAHALG